MKKKTTIGGFSDWELDTGNKRGTLADIEAQVSPEIFAQIVGFIALMEGLSDICPKCHATITDMKQVGKDTYGSCGCYLGESFGTDNWHKE